jgi:hypothetical protein
MPTQTHAVCGEPRRDIAHCTNFVTTNSSQRQPTAHSATQDLISSPRCRRFPRLIHRYGYVLGPFVGSAESIQASKIARAPRGPTSRPPSASDFSKTDHLPHHVTSALYISGQFLRVRNLLRFKPCILPWNKEAKIGRG